jgi:hypothetical protein
MEGSLVRRTILRVLLAAGLVVGANAVAVAPAFAAVCDGSGSALANGGFEVPGVAAGDEAPFPAAQVPPWQTTDVIGQIEIWGDGFQGVPAGEGVDFAEINANSAGTLYQDVVTTPGQTMHWSLLHRARIGTDVMHVLIGDANTADPASDTGWDFISADISDDTTAWGAHEGDYVVPAGQTCTRFAFRAVSSGAGDPSFGNFLDAVGFSIPVPPTPTPHPTLHVTEPPTDTARIDTTAASTMPWASVLLGVGMAVTAAGLAAFAIQVRRTRR